MRTRSVDRGRWPLFLDRAEGFLATARDALAQDRRQAAASSAIHAAIAAGDAVTVFHVGRRSASDRHEDAVDLLRSLDLPEAGFRTRVAQFGRLLSLKAKVEYADAEVTRREAADAVRTAERLVGWAREHLPKARP